MKKENQAVTSLRMPRRMLADLQALAHRRSLELGRTVTWQSLVRRLVADQLLGGGGVSHHNPTYP